MYTSLLTSSVLLWKMTAVNGYRWSFTLHKERSYLGVNYSVIWHLQGIMYTLLSVSSVFIISTAVLEMMMTASFQNII